MPYKHGVTGSSPVVPTIYLARWCSRLARQPVTLEVDGSSPFRVATKKHAFQRAFFFLLGCGYSWAIPHNLTRRLSQDFCPNSKFGKWRNPSCIPIFQTEEVGKRTAEARRHNCAVLPLRGWIAEKRFLLAKSKCLCHNNKSLAAVPGIYGNRAAREAAVKSIGFIGISFIREEEGFT